MTLSGTYLGHAVPLGELRLDRDANLLILGGAGVSRTFENASIGADFYNNPGWHDDLWMGRYATIRFADGTVVNAEPAMGDRCAARLRSADQGVVTLYDTVLQAALSANLTTIPAQPSFTDHILSADQARAWSALGPR